MKIKDYLNNEYLIMQKDWSDIKIRKKSKEFNSPFSVFTVDFHTVNSKKEVIEKYGELEILETPTYITRWDRLISLYGIIFVPRYKSFHNFRFYKSKWIKIKTVQ